MTHEACDVDLACYDYNHMNCMGFSSYSGIKPLIVSISYSVAATPVSQV